MSRSPLQCECFGIFALCGSISHMQRRLLLNFSPITFGDGEVTIELLRFESADQLAELRTKRVRTHLLRRQGDDIQVVALRPDSANLGGKPTTVKLSENLPLVAALVRESLVSYLHGIGRAVEGYHPITFAAGGERDSLLTPPPDAHGEVPLDVRPRYDLEVRTVSLDHREPFVGVAFNVRSTRQINGTCAEWLARGLDVTGLYVGNDVQDDDPRLGPRLQLMGKVQSHDTGQLLLEDKREDAPEVISASAVKLEPRIEAFKRCLSVVHGSLSDTVKNDLSKELHNLRSGPGRLNRITRVVSFLAAREFELVPGHFFRLNPFLEEGASKSFPAINTAPKPTYVFDASGSRTDTWNDGGLRKHGPFSADVFTPSRPRICVICQAKTKGQIDQFLQKFLYGVRPNAQGKAPFSDGLIRKYALEGVTHEYFLVDGRTSAAYKKAARAALERQTEIGSKWDLALIQIEEQFHDLRGDDNPYFVMKATFLAQQINVQEFEIETVTATNETQLGYSLNNMALATYAKLGGTPWILRSDRTRAHELVIGIGSASIGEGRLGDRERVVGITTVFSGDGNYYLSSASKSVPISEYRDAMLSTLKASVDRAKAAMNWQQRDHVRLVFHSFKPLKNSEVDAVKAFMEQVGDYDVDYAFVELVENHPYLVFDKYQEGISTYGGRPPKGKLAPTRGWFFQISDFEMLLCLTGAKELKKAEDGMPWPILVRLHRESTFKDITYLAKQAFAFSAHSWRSFFPSHLPVTILYSELVAKHLGKLSKLPWWNPDAMLGRVGESRWFL